MDQPYLWHRPYLMADDPIAVAIFQIPIQINDDHDRTGRLGETGKTFWFGPIFTCVRISTATPTRTVKNTFRQGDAGRFDDDASHAVFESDESYRQAHTSKALVTMS